MIRLLADDENGLVCGMNSGDVDAFHSDEEVVGLQSQIRIS